MNAVLKLQGCDSQQSQLVTILEIQEGGGGDGVVGEGYVRITWVGRAVAPKIQL